MTVELSADFVTVKGPIGEVKMHILPLVKVTEADGHLHFEQTAQTRESNANVGTMRALVNDMVKGCATGFEKRLALVGVGYRAQAQGDKLNLSLGFSHPVVHQMRPPRRKSSSRAPTSRRLVRRPLRFAPTALPSPTRARACATRTSTS